MMFQRARSEEHKFARRVAILAKARALCSEFGAMGWSLNELGRRADITKSNLYRYFSSREEILVVLLLEETLRYAEEFEQRTAGRQLTLKELCDELAKGYERQPLLCDILCVSGSVLEPSIELEPIQHLKRQALSRADCVAASITRCFPDADKALANEITFFSGVFVVGLWPLARPASPGRQLAKREGLERLDADFGRDLRRLLKSQIKGILLSQPCEPDPR